MARGGIPEVSFRAAINAKSSLNVESTEAALVGGLFHFLRLRLQTLSLVVRVGAWCQRPHRRFLVQHGIQLSASGSIIPPNYHRCLHHTFAYTRYWAPSQQRVKGGGVVVGTVMIRCPKTGRAISTGIRTDVATFHATPVFFSQVLCPLCQLTHEWFAKDAWICDMPGE